MKLLKGTEVYFAAPHKVYKCVVARDFEGEWSDSQEPVLATIEEFGNQEVYIDTETLYFSKEHAEARVKLNDQIKELRSSDIATEITNHVLKN